MAKLYSSIREETIYDWENRVRPCLMALFEKDLDNEEKVFKEVVKYMKALDKVNRLGFKLKCTVVDEDDPRVIRGQKEYETALEKQKEFISKFGGEMGKLLYIFVMELADNGLKKMICEDGIARGLTARPGEFRYYEWRP